MNINVSRTEKETKDRGCLRTGCWGECLNLTGWRNPHEELHNLYSSPTIIRINKLKKGRLVRHVARMGEMRNAYQILVEKSEGWPLWGADGEDDINVNRIEVRCECVDLIHLSLDRVQWRDLAKALMNLRIPWKTANFLSRWETVTFLWQMLLRAIEYIWIQGYSKRSIQLQKIYFTSYIEHMATCYRKTEGRTLKVIFTPYKHSMWAPRVTRQMSNR
jgi:hypothetical protein